MQDILNPAHNLREVAKQLLLLENHLCNPERRCSDCIAKHLLTLEAYAEEAAELDTGGTLQEAAYALAEVARRAWHMVFYGQVPPQQIQQWLRQHRKHLMNLLRNLAPVQKEQG